MNQIAERMGLDEVEKEVMELVVDTAAAMRFGPQAALTKLGIELARRGSRDLAEFVIEKLKEDDRINDEQARMVLKRMDRVAPEGLPEPLKDAATSAARSARRFVDTPENRERIASARESARRRARRIREASADRIRETFGRPVEPEAVNDIGETGPPIGLPPRPALRGEPIVSLSSGRVNNSQPIQKTLNPGALSEESKKVRSSGPSTSLGDIRRDEVTIYDVAGKRVAFGLPEGQSWEQDLSDVEVLPINPFVISGLDETSPEGREVAINWALAQAAINDEERGSQSGTEASALLYAATRGDTEAEKKLNDLAEKGREAVRNEQSKLDQQRQPIIDMEKQRREEFVNQIKSRPGITDEQVEKLTRPSKQNGYSGLSVDDLYLVHETTYDVEYDEDGNVVLRPNGDYPMLDEDGNPLLDAEGRPWDTYRGTLHFSVNHRVGGHAQRESPEEANVIMIPLRAVLDANPGSLDNLYGVDTYLTPPPGEPLRLPASAVRTIKIEKGEKDPWGKVHDELKDMGMSPDVAMFGGADSVGLDADERIRGIAAELGTHSMMHSHSDNAAFEKMRKHMAQKFPVTPGLFANLSRNAILRLMHQDRWMGVDAVSAPETQSVV